MRAFTSLTDTPPAVAVYPYGHRLDEVAQAQPLFLGDGVALFRGVDLCHTQNRGNQQTGQQLAERVADVHIAPFGEIP